MIFQFVMTFDMTKFDTWSIISQCGLIEWTVLSTGGRYPVLNQLRLPLYNPVTEEASDPKFAIHRPEELYYRPVALRCS